MDADGRSQREAAAALLAASEQIALALQDSQPSVEALTEALSRLSAALAAGTTDAGGQAALRAEMQRAITCLQYHDRMTQHLNHVREYLAGIAAQMSSRDERDAGRWSGLHRRLRERLRSGHDARSTSEPGDIDLF